MGCANIAFHTTITFLIHECNSTPFIVMVYWYIIQYQVTKNKQFCFHSSTMRWICLFLILFLVQLDSGCKAACENKAGDVCACTDRRDQSREHSEKWTYEVVFRGNGIEEKDFSCHCKCDTPSCDCCIQSDRGCSYDDQFYGIRG